MGITQSKVMVGIACFYAKAYIALGQDNVPGNPYVFADLRGVNYGIPSNLLTLAKDLLPRCIGACFSAAKSSGLLKELREQVGSNFGVTHIVRVQETCVR